MEKKNVKKYIEISLDTNEHGYSGGYMNPLTRVYQYEYALFKTMADLFSSVRCQSLCITSLKLYFAELPHSSESIVGVKFQNEKKEKGKSQEAVLKEMEQLVSRDVIGHITFPKMSICAVEVKTIPEKDGTHSFVYTDGIYCFRIHMIMPKNKKHPSRIEVDNYV